MNFYPRSQILKGLWIGSKKDACDQDFLKGIHLIVNCTKNVPCYTDKIKYVQVEVDDDPRENGNMLRALFPTVKIIHEFLERGQHVLIHCFAGLQRSCAVAAAYLMYKGALLNTKVSSTYAIDSVRKRKSGAFLPTPTFEPALKAFETS